jgi:predicted RNA binding protein YcfA (HicA-like mRNA interferase family)
MPPDRIPASQPRRVVAALEACGLVIKRQSGSHIMLTRAGLRRPVVVAMHGRELGPKVIAKIVSQAGVDLDEFLKNL